MTTYTRQTCRYTCDGSGCRSSSVNPWPYPYPWQQVWTLAGKGTGHHLVPRGIPVVLPREGWISVIASHRHSVHTCNNYCLSNHYPCDPLQVGKWKNHWNHCSDWQQGNHLLHWPPSSHEDEITSWEACQANVLTKCQWYKQYQRNDLIPSHTLPLNPRKRDDIGLLCPWSGRKEKHHPWIPLADSTQSPNWLERGNCPPNRTSNSQTWWTRSGRTKIPPMVPGSLSTVQPLTCHCHLLTTKEEGTMLTGPRGRSSFPEKAHLVYLHGPSYWESRTETSSSVCPTVYTKVFDEPKTGKLPPRRPFDHAIDLLKDTFVPKVAKAYPLNPKEMDGCKEFIDEHLKSGKIWKSQSPQASPFFFVQKKDGGLHPCQDYQYLNEHTVKNAYLLSLISTLIDKLKGAKVFSKMDIQWGYNNIWIKEGTSGKLPSSLPTGSMSCWSCSSDNATPLLPSKHS